MSNHVHVVAVPVRCDSLAKALGRTHFRYTQYVNRFHGRSGHLWQNRFYSCPLDEAHTLCAVRCVERNPVRAKMVRAPWRYRWSSAKAHVSGNDAANLLDMKAWRRIRDSCRWKAQLRRADDEEELAALRSRTRTGRPLGSDSFVSKLETAVGRRLRALPVGRPRRQNQ
jgi:putative transposase